MAIVELKLIVSVENDPSGMLNPEGLKDEICTRLIGYKFKTRGVEMCIKDAGVFGTSLPSFIWDHK